MVRWRLFCHTGSFRGAAEGKIRKALLEKGQIDAIIGMPAGLFYSTGIPTIVMVLRKHRDNRDVLFIDASKGFEKGKTKISCVIKTLTRLSRHIKTPRRR